MDGLSEGQGSCDLVGIGTSHFFYKLISTRHLTWLTTGAIVTLDGMCYS